MIELKKKFGRSVKKLRTEKGITQEELAGRASISVDLLSLIERGKSAPSFKTLEQIAIALEVEVKQLFE